MHLVNDWRSILRRAHSVRANFGQVVVTGSFAGAVMFWPALQDRIPLIWFVIGALIVNIGGPALAIILRVIDQGGIDHKKG